MSLDYLFLFLFSPGSCSSPQKNTKELVKAMHGSSIKLLCTNFSGDDELEPHDYRLLYSVINNIALVLKDKKVVVIPLWPNMVQ